MAGEDLVYELAEYALVVMIAAMVGGISFVAVAAFLAVLEGVNATYRRLRARYSPTWTRPPVHHGTAGVR
jgi:hypothetical protein